MRPIKSSLRLVSFGARGSAHTSRLVSTVMGGSLAPIGWHGARHLKTDQYPREEHGRLFEGTQKPFDVGLGAQSARGGVPMSEHAP
jgi:hypothetical protein